MAKVICPACQGVIPAQDVDLASGWAKCSQCDEVFQLEGRLPHYRREDAAVPERPAGARAHVEKMEGELRIAIPPEGMRSSYWGALFFASVWTGFIAFWTLGALGVFFNGPWPPPAANVAFSLFSIPFWLVGFGSFAGVIWAARTKRLLRIGPHDATWYWKCLWFSRSRTFPTSDIQVVRPFARLRSDDSTHSHDPELEIVHQNGSIVLPANLSEERDWLIHEINKYLGSVRSPSPRAIA